MLSRGSPRISKRKDTLSELVKEGNAEELSKSLARASTEEVNKKDQYGQTLLHYALETQQEELVRLLASCRSVDASARDQRGRTALHLAVRSRKLRLVEHVLGITRHVDVPGPNDRTALHVSTVECLVDVARLLVDHGASPLKKDKKDMTPIGIAASNGSLAILDIFLSSPASCNTLELLQSTCGIENSSLLHLAVKSGSTEAVVYLLHKNINKRFMDAEGFTALHVAARMGHVHIIRQLIESDRWLLNAPNHCGVTPLHEAAKHDQVMAVNYLLSKGANLDALTSSGASPLLFAALFGAHETVRELLTHNVNYLERDEDGVNVLHCAVGHIKTLKVLAMALKDRPGFQELVSGTDNNGATALHYASQYGHSSDVILLAEYRARLDAVNRDGATPLHFATKRGHLRLVAQLLSCAPRLLNAVDGCGRTPLHIACLYGHPKILGKLLMSGAILMPDCDGRTPFHCAAWNGSTKCLKTLFSAFPDDVDSGDNEKATALHMAVASNHPDAITYLLDQGAKITDNEFGLNCLDIAIAKELENCASVVVGHERWKESMKPIASSPTAATQLQLLVQKMPEQGLVIMDRCVESSQKNSGSEQSYDFRYMLGITDGDEEVQIQSRAPRQLLEAMVKLNRSSCLAHPLCVEFLNTMWRKFVAAVVFLNIGLYAVFLLLLMGMVVYFPAYSPHLLKQEDSIKRLLDVLLHAKQGNRTILNEDEKFEICYGNAVLRLAVIIATVLCLIKEVLPMWFKGVEYFKRMSNICELVVYGLTLFFLDPFGLLLKQHAIPEDSCPKLVWEVAAVTVVLAWIVLLMNFQRVPHVGIFIVMIVSMVKTMIQVVVVASLFILGFGLAFYMVMNNEVQFFSGGLSLMRMVTMAVGDLAYDDILPVSEHQANANFSSYYNHLQNLSGQFSFINSLLLPNMRETVSMAMSADCNVSSIASSSDTAADDSSVQLLISPFLSYAFFICFALLMPIVVLNVLIGLAVGDIEAVRAHAALRQIRMQIKLLVELETALPAWFLKHVHVVRRCYYPDKETYLHQMVRQAMNAAEDMKGKEKTEIAIGLAKVKHNIREVKEWLNSLEQGLEQQLVMMKTFAACVKRIQTMASRDAVEKNGPTTAVEKDGRTTAVEKDGPTTAVEKDGSTTADVPADDSNGKDIDDHLLDSVV